MQPLVDREVACVVDGSLGAQGPTFFVVLLDLGVLVVHVQRRNDSFSQHTRAKASRRTLVHATFKNELPAGKCNDFGHARVSNTRSDTVSILLGAGLRIASGS